MEDELDNTLIDNSQIFSRIILFTPELEVLPKEERVKFRKEMRKKRILQHVDRLAIFLLLFRTGEAVDRRLVVCENSEWMEYLWPDIEST